MNGMKQRLKNMFLLCPMAKSSPIGPQGITCEELRTCLINLLIVPVSKRMK